MAATQSQLQPTKAAFGLFRGVSWSQIRKKSKQANLGDENNMYYHPELKRWVERGKEEEAEREAAGPPPPLVVPGGSYSTATYSKRSISQRYVLQPNLSVSSMGSLAGSFSNTDLASLTGPGGVPDSSLSGPPSAIGSTTPSPPQSSRGLLLPLQPGLASGPSSMNGGVLPPPFYMPATTNSPSRASSGFFMPSAPAREQGHTDHATDTAAPDGSGATEGNVAYAAAPSTKSGPAHANSGSYTNGKTSEANNQEPITAEDRTQCSNDVGLSFPQPTIQNGTNNHAAVGSVALASPIFGRAHSENLAAGNPLLPFHNCSPEDGLGPTLSGPPHRNYDSSVVSESCSVSVSRSMSATAELSLVAHPLIGATSSTASANAYALALQGGSCATADELTPAESSSTSGGADGRSSSLSFFPAVNVREPDRQVESPVPLYGLPRSVDVANGSKMSCEGEGRGTASHANASNGGTAMSVHVGNGVATRALRQGPSEEWEPESGEAAEGDPAAAVVLGEGVVEEPSTAVGASAETQAVGAGAEAGAPGDSGAGTADAGAGASLYSQYYYQQYAYLYQYALGQGYGEAEAVSYAHYYAATYAAQYEAQAPDGQIGSSGTEAGDATVVMVAAEQQEAICQVETSGSVVMAPRRVSIISTVVAAESPSAEMAGTSPGEVSDVGSSRTLTGASAAAVEGEASAQAMGGQVVVGEHLTASGFGNCHMATGNCETQINGLPTGNIVVPSQPPCAQDVPLAVHPVAPVVDDIGLVRAAPLAPELTAAAAAATQHHQSAVTAVVAAVQATAGSRTAGLAVVTPAADVSQAVETAAAVQPSSGAQLLLRGLGAAGTRHLTQLSSAASAAVASLGASVAASVPLAAALSAAATSAAAVAGRAYENGLSEDDFDRIMHPGDPAKLDGPLPWELPDHLRTDRKFLTFCANWHLGNPGKAYAPHMLLQAYERQLTLPKAEVGTEAQPQPSNRGDVAPAAEGGVLPFAEAGKDAASVSEQPQRQQVSTYERACRLSQFGEPAATLLPQASPRSHQEKANKHISVSVAEVMQRQLDAAPIVISPVYAKEPTAVVTLSFKDAVSMQITEAAGVLEVDAYRRVTLEEVTEESSASSSEGSAQVECLEPRAASASATGSQPLGPMGAVEAASFFGSSGNQTPAASEGPQSPSELASSIPNSDVSTPVVPAARPHPERQATQTSDAEEVGTVGTAPIPPPMAAAAAAIDSILLSLEQLRAVDGTTVNTALLQHIHSSLAQATAALAGMGLDINALATLSGATKSPAEWTPGMGSKRPRVHDSPSTPTRPTTGLGSGESVDTPRLPPGPPLQREVSAAGSAVPSAVPVAVHVPCERLQSVSRRLSDDPNGGAQGALLPLPRLPQLLHVAPVVVQLSVVDAPAVDEAAMVERARAEERTAWEARIEAVIDSERGASASAVASVEQDRDGLATRVGELEKQLAVVVAERDALAQRLASAKAEAAVSLSEARSQATAERAALSAQLTAAEAAREELGGQLAAERAEKEALAAALSTARSETEELRQRYAERFASLSSELAATRGSLAELQAEHDELLLCLGQESTKVVVLTDALRDAGSDPEPLIQRIEAEYETMGIGAEEQGEDEQGSGDGWEGEELGV